MFGVCFPYRVWGVEEMGWERGGVCQRDREIAIIVITIDVGFVANREIGHMESRVTCVRARACGDDENI